MVWGNTPPPLTMPSPRRLSMSSVSSSRSSRNSSPILSALDSSSALILVHDPEDDNTPFDFDSDDDDDDGSPQFDVRRPSVPPLGPTLVFLYLLVPYLKLGALLLPHTELPLKYGLPLLLIFSGLSVFSRQLWYMLARYMRTADLEDVILDALARGRGKERRRCILRTTIRAGTGGLRVLLSTVYLRESLYVLLPLFPNNLLTVRLMLTASLALAVLPLSFAQSLASRRIVYTTWLSLATYIAWLLCIIYAYSHGIPLLNSGWLRMGTFWQGIVTIAFTFTSSSTLSLYSSLRGSNPPVTTKPSKIRSFKTISALSVSIAVLLTLPLVIFSANPNVPATLSIPLPPISITISVLNAATLLLGIPVLIITSPPLPIPERTRHATIIPISKLLLWVITTGLTFVPPGVFVVLSDILLLLALTSTYFLPALIHVIAHFFKRPLAIVMPQIPGTPSLVPQEGSSQSHTGPDDLLLRKERALQKKQFRKRILWDIGVWVLLLGGGTGFIWAIGRVAGRW